jgi:ubiquinone biosynthesis protein COQ9
MTLPTDPTLDEIRLHLAPRIARDAGFDGWGEAALASAATSAGIDPGIARLAFPGGAVDMIDAWFADIDAGMGAAFPPDRIAGMKIRERITALVAWRIACVAPDREALGRALAILALPTNLARATRLGWRAADAIWWTAGDRSTDAAHYTKRATLAAVYGTTLLALLDDQSAGHAETYAFLDRRIADVMRFEAFKARWRRPAEGSFSVTRLLGRLRYPAT